MAKTKSYLLDVAQACHTSFHKDTCAPVDLFEVHNSYDGFVYLVPNHHRGINYFFGDTMMFIGGFLNDRHILWRVVNLHGSAAIKLLYV